jgi:hydroxylamine reductase
MLPANAYPELKKFEDLYGNYGNAWYSQNNEFERFNGPILMTSNCIIPPRASYRTRLFTTGAAGWPGVRHIPTPTDGTMKDFTEIIRMAKTCVPPEPLTQSANGTPEPEFLEIGFGISQLKACAEEIAAGIKSGEIARIVVMGGCDGRQVERKYYTELARQFPENVLILTAGCAKYRFNKLETGSLGSLPRVLDAGQCNDTWSIACFMVELCEMMNVQTVNELPVTFEIAWYEQKSVSVLLGLLALGVRNINLGPTLPAFCSPNIIKYMNENYGLQKIRTVQEELKEICMQTTCMA